MRFIDKKLINQPAELITYKKTTTPAPTYADFKDKDVLRQALLEEQGFICGYCMRRIANDSLNTKIEHYQEQCNFPAKSLDFDNMLAVCSGHLNNNTKNPICDTKRGSFDKTQQSLIINPFDKNQMAKITFSEGRVEIDDVDMQNDLDIKLNLNHQTLLENRLAKLEVIRQEVTKTFPKAKMITKAYIEQKISEYSKPDANGKLKEYCQVYIYWLEKQRSKAV